MTVGLDAALKGRRGQLVLDAAFTAPAGAITVLGGASGAGKTTILRALAGLERLAGHVVVGDGAWQDGRRFRPPWRRRVGYVFQQGALFPHLDVRGNLEFARRRSGAGPADVDDAVTALGLEPLLARMPDRLSGGERARVALGRALLTRPDLLLLDEPLTGLDAAARDRLLPVLREALRALEAPVLLVTHDGAEARALGDRRVLVQDGRAVETPVDADPIAGLSPEAVADLARAALSAGLKPSR